LNIGLTALQPYPFERLNALLQGAPPADIRAIPLTIGEPQHAPPVTVTHLLAEHGALVGKYPTTTGSASLRGTMARWLEQRFALAAIDADQQVLPLNGTREGLFALAQTVVTHGQPGAVISPNPFYQIYEGAALLAGSTPHFANCDHSHGFTPDFSQITPDQWQACQLLYICTPGNPAGAVLSTSQLQHLITLAQEHDFVIASDECYSEIYPNEGDPPPGLLGAAATMGVEDYRNCLCFHSLSKRSNLPGLRSGFVAGDSLWIERFRRYRTYHGCTMPTHHQVASEWAWSDEAHVVENRARYRDKFNAVLPIISGGMATPTPEAGFYLWPETPIDDEVFAAELWRRTGVSVLPGRYLARDTPEGNPGAKRVRIALVAERELCVEAVERMANSLRQGW
jgi:N-succinyldiaminopimelate aminotransferase